MDDIQEINVHDVLSNYKVTPGSKVIELTEEEILANYLEDNLEKMQMGKLWSLEVGGMWVFVMVKKETHTVVKNFNDNKFQPLQVKREEKLPVIYFIQIGEGHIHWEELEKEEDFLGIFATMCNIFLKLEIRPLVIATEYQLKNFINSHL